ncbi:MAG: SdpI family protein [Bacteroidia bacterium]
MEFLIANLLISLIYILAGIITLLYPPKDINYLYGYRTSRSMKSKDAWKASNSFASKLMILAGIDLLILGVILYLIGVNDEKIWGVFTIISVILISIMIYLLTENYLKNNFDENGNPL